MKSIDELRTLVDEELCRIKYPSSPISYTLLEFIKLKSKSK